MPAHWIISAFPPCEFHVFLSHAAEDRERLVSPLNALLKSRGIIPWYDQHHYPAGVASYEALRAGILKCRHMVYLITSALLRQGRGWANPEKAYGGLLQENLRQQDVELCHIELPLFFISRNDKKLPRSMWLPLLDKARFAPRGCDRVNWAADQITNFVIQEQRNALGMVGCDTDPILRAMIEAQPGMMDRVLARYPTLASIV